MRRRGAQPMSKKKDAKRKKLKKSCCGKPLRKMCKRCPRVLLEGRR